MLEHVPDTASIVKVPTKTAVVAAADASDSTVSVDVASPAHASRAPLLSLAALEAVRHDQRVAGCAQVLRSEAAVDRTGQPYLVLTLRGADGGRIAARWWRYPCPIERRPIPGQIYTFTGTSDRYGGEVQLRVLHVRAAPALEFGSFSRTTRRTLEELTAQLDAHIATLDADLAALVHAILKDDIYERYCTWPAAQVRHGAVQHGLLAHSLHVAELAAGMAEVYGSEHLPHDPGIVRAACLLHDLGKIYTLPQTVGGTWPDAARQFDHVTLSVLLVREAAARLERPGVAADRLDARLDALLHAMLAHHGRAEWGAPVEPHTVEAWLVHLADYAEAHLWSWAREEVPSVQLDISAAPQQPLHHPVHPEGVSPASGL